MRLCVIFTEFRKAVTSAGSGRVRYRPSVKRLAPALLWTVIGKSSSSAAIPCRASM